MRKGSSKLGKTALVLAGGGLTGAVYEIGALRAIDDLLVDRTVNDFDIYVGTSAGALVASLLASGISPEAMLQVVDGSHPEISPIRSRQIFTIDPNYLLRWGIGLPKKVFNALTEYVRQIGDMTFFDLLWSFTETLPAGLYDSLALEKFIALALQQVGQTNHFDELPRDLSIIATDLNSGERAVFGCGGRSDAPISLAVAASSALPLVYKPVKIGDSEFVDGGLRGNASLDIAIEQGASLVVCINPMVPFHESELHPKNGGKTHPFISQRGIQSIANQVLRITTHAGLQYHIKQLRRSHPEVDIILIEPEPDDYQVLVDNIMRYSTRLAVARHGFESATLSLAEDYVYYKQILARHGIPISRRLVIEEISEIVTSDYNPEVIRRVLEARSNRCGQSRHGNSMCELNRALAELELTLDSWEED
jgi:predicted acylesterase/phospholipase RssA